MGEMSDLSRCEVGGCEKSKKLIVTQQRKMPGPLGGFITQTLYHRRCYDHMDEFIPAFRHKMNLKILKGI